MLWRAPVIRREPSLAIPAACHAACSVDDVALELPVLAQPAPALDQPLGAIARDLLRLRGALGLQRLLGRAQHPAPITAGAQPLRELVAARLAEQLVLGRVNRGRFLEDLARDLPVVARGVVGGRRGDLRPVDRDHTDLDQAAARAQRQHLAEQLGDRLLVAHPEARDRRAIGRPTGADHPKRHVVVAATLDRPRRAHPDRVGVDEQRHHHRRIVRRPAPPVVAITGLERRQLHLGDRVEHEPRQVLLGRPLAQARRQQQLLLAVTRDEVLHRRIVLNRPDATGFVRHPPRGGAVAEASRESAGSREMER
jgi:hypothetical protein